jgi:hypothetical protein
MSRPATYVNEWRFTVRHTGTPNGQGAFLEPTTSDLITDLLPSRRRNRVDDVILMQIRHLYFLPEGYRRTCAGELLFGRVASIFDMLKNMISVRGSIFTSKFWSSLCYYNSLGVKCRFDNLPMAKPNTKTNGGTLFRYYANFEDSSKITAIISAIRS